MRSKYQHGKPLLVANLRRLTGSRAQRNLPPDLTRPELAHMASWTATECKAVVDLLDLDLKEVRRAIAHVDQLRERQADNPRDKP